MSQAASRETTTSAAVSGKRETNLAQHATGSVLTRGALVILGVLAGVVVNRSLQPEGRGLLTTCQALYSVVIPFGTLGMGRSAILFLGRGQHVDREISGTVTLTSLGSATFISLVVACLWGNLVDVPQGVSRNWLLAAMLLTLSLQLIATFQECLARGKMEISACNRSFLIQGAGYFMLVMALVVFGEASVPAVLGALGLSYVGSLIYFLHANARLFGGVSLNFSPGLFRQMIMVGVTFQMLGVVQELFSRVPVLMLSNLWVDPGQALAATGFYSTAIGLASMANQVPAALGVVLYPWSASRSKEEAYAGTARTFRVWLIALLGVGGGLWVFAPQILSLLYGTAFLPAAFLMRVAMLGVLASGAATLMSGYLASQGRLATLVRVGMVAVAVSITLNLVLIPRWGALGAATTLCLAGLVNLSLTLRAFIRVGHGCWGDVLPGSEDLRMLFRKIGTTASSRWRAMKRQ